MHLAQWIEEQDLTATSFARSIGVPHSTISRVIAGKRAPSDKVMRKIIAGTAGKVMPNDFYDLSEILESA